MGANKDVLRATLKQKHHQVPLAAFVALLLVTTCVRLLSTQHSSLVTVSFGQPRAELPHHLCKEQTLSGSKPITLFVGVLSAPDHAQARQVIRETWGADPRIYRLMFFTQRPHSDDAFRLLRQEAVALGDVVVSSEIYGAYYNTTYSVLELFRTAAHLGDGITHVVKTDDDCYMRVSLLLPALADMPRHWLYAGNPLRAGKARRNPGWHYVPYSNWESDAKVRYGHGPGIVLSIDLAREIAAGAPHMIMPADKLLMIEDLAVGYWVEYVGQEQGVEINYNDTIKISLGDCVDSSMFHVVHADIRNDSWAKPQSYWEALRCMHGQGGACCHEHDRGPMMLPEKWASVR